MVVLPTAEALGLKPIQAGCSGPRNHEISEGEMGYKGCSMTEVPPYRPLSGKTILYGVTGGIAAYKAAEYARNLTKLGAAVVPVLSRNARRFISPLTFSALTGQRSHTDLFDLSGAETIPHIELARSSDLFIILPATASIIGKAANGLADDLISTLLLSYSGPVLFFPSMNPYMYGHAATQENLKALRALGYGIVGPDTGEAACGEVGQGRLVPWDTAKEGIIAALTPSSLSGITVVVTAGPTRESVDPVRFISNRSSGLMGYAMAKVARRRGAEVKLVSGPVSLERPPGVEFHGVETAAEMAEIVKGLAGGADVVVMAAAVADYTPRQSLDRKMKKSASNLTLELMPAEDILSFLTSHRRLGQIIVGFCAETHDLKANALKKKREKGVDLLVANDVSMPGVGFDVPTNEVLIIDPEEEIEQVPMLHKEEVAEHIWDRIQGLVS